MSDKLMALNDDKLDVAAIASAMRELALEAENDNRTVAMLDALEAARERIDRALQLIADAIKRRG